jgi:hypothetical protein
MGKYFQAIRLHDIEGTECFAESEGLPLVIALAVVLLEGGPIELVPLGDWVVSER